MNSKSIHLLFNTGNECKNTLLEWVKEKSFSNIAFIIDKENSLSQENFPYPIFSIETLIPISSRQEESIYRRCHHYRKFFIKKFIIPFQGVNLFEDEIRGFNFELTLRYITAYMELHKEYDDVIIAISSDTANFLPLIKTIIRTANLSRIQQKVNCLIFRKKDSTLKKINGNSYIYYLKLLLDKILKKFTFLITHKKPLKNNPSLFEKVHENAHLKKSVHQKISIAKPCLFITTETPLYRNNFTPVYKKLCETIETPLAIASTYQIAKAASNRGIQITSSLNVVFSFLSPFFIINATVASIRCIYLTAFYLFKTSRFHFKDPFAKLFQKQMIILLSSPIFLFRFLRSLLKIKQIDSLLKKYKPNIIYKDIAHSNYDARIAMLAKRHNIPVAASVIASITSRYRNFAIYPCDFITILGESQRDIFKKQSYKDEQIITAGQPELDNVKTQWTKESSYHYLSTIVPNYSQSQFTILIATGYVDLKNEKNWIKTISDYATQQKQPIQILIKPHPSVGNFYEDCANLPQIILLDHTTELYPLLIASNLVVTDASHTGKLAIFFKKRLMIANFSGSSFKYNNFDQEKVAWLATNPYEVHEVINGILNNHLTIDDNHYNTYIQRHLTSDNGKAADRIVDLLLSPQK